MRLSREWNMNLWLGGGGEAAVVGGGWVRETESRYNKWSLSQYLGDSSGQGLITEATSYTQQVSEEYLR